MTLTNFGRSVWKVLMKNSRVDMSPPRAPRKLSCFGGSCPPFSMWLHSEQVRQMLVAPHRGDGARRDLVEKVRERLDGRGRDCVARHEPHLGVAVRTFGRLPEDVVDGALVRIHHERADPRLLERGGVE